MEASLYLNVSFLLPCFIPFFTSFSSLFSPLSSLLSLNYLVTLLCWSIYMFNTFILLYFLSPIVWSFWNFSFYLIKILCCFAIFGGLLESHFLSRNTGPHLCDAWTFLWYLSPLFPGICNIFHISGYDTQTIVDNNGKTEYGLFQINNKLWCRDNQIQSRNICDISCDSE